MSKRMSRRKLLAGAAIPVAAVPLARLAGAGGNDAGASTSNHIGHQPRTGRPCVDVRVERPCSGRPERPRRPAHTRRLPSPHSPGRVREYTLVAQDREIEVAEGVTYAAWTYNGTVPGPVLRATEGDIFRVEFHNRGTHPHTIHFHGIHPSDMDGVFETVAPGRSFTYEFEAHPYGMHLYHCHATPLKKHIEKGLYGALIIDPPEPRAPARELVMVMNGYDTDGDGENNFYTVNGLAFYYAKYPIRVKRGELVRIYLANLTEFDLINSLHIHANFFRYYPTGSTDQFEYTDTVMLCQGQRGILELEFPNPGQVHVPRPPVGVRGARLDGLLPGRGVDGGRSCHR